MPSLEEVIEAQDRTRDALNQAIGQVAEAMGHAPDGPRHAALLAILMQLQATQVAQQAQNIDAISNHPDVVAAVDALRAISASLEAEVQVLRTATDVVAAATKVLDIGKQVPPAIQKIADFVAQRAA